MRRVLDLYRSSVGKKVVMALTGFVLILFVLGHMAGNLKAFQGAVAFNHYAEGLREFGEPFLPRTGALWIVRIGLLGAVLLHIVAAVQLTRTSHDARSVGYAREESLAFSYASRTMRWGGVVILAFVVYHLLHLTTGTVHADFVAGDAYRNLVVGFSNPWITSSYIVATGALGLHLYHGIWSTFQTLGLNHPKYNHLRRPLAAVLALVVFVGFASVPAAVMAGAIS